MDTNGHEWVGWACTVEEGNHGWARITTDDLLRFLGCRASRLGKVLSPHQVRRSLNGYKFSNPSQKSNINNIEFWEWAQQQF
jgi:hypothetical protein